jgi:hypothetical protein
MGHHNAGTVLLGGGRDEESKKERILPDYTVVLVEVPMSFSTDRMLI